MCAYTGIGHLAAAVRRKWLGRPSVRFDARSWKGKAADKVPAQKGCVPLGIGLLPDWPGPECALNFRAA